MRNSLRFVVALLLMSTSASAAPPRQSADIVLRNGVVATMDATRSWAQAVAIRGGRVVFVGTDRDVATWIGRQTRVTDLGGRLVLPSFHDSHVHPVTSGMELLTCDLNEAKTTDDVFATIRRYAASHPDVPWIRGGGWQLPIFGSAGPTRAQLDALAADRPGVALVRRRTQLVGELAGSRDRRSDEGDARSAERPHRAGRKRRADGHPAEDATELVTRFAPKPSHADHVAGLRLALQKANGFGITSLYEANGSEAALAAYKELDDRGELTARVHVALQIDTAKGVAEIPRLIELRRRFAGRRLSANAVKIFADGVIEAQTAALLEPYVNRPGDRGKPNIEPDALKSLVAALDREGFQVHIHAIGDRAIRMSLDAFEHARSVNGVRTLVITSVICSSSTRRHSAISPARCDRELSAALGICRSVHHRPHRASSGPGAIKVALSVQKRRSYRRGGRGGSDWSVSSINPLDAIQVAVTRRGLEDATGKPWIPRRSSTYRPSSPRTRSTGRT
ncbi:MAG: amidohydrolase family protein [Blastocatellia bacterium]|nr:amidohydrolase family protein [Blastocatellia bacterium]